MAETASETPQTVSDDLGILARRRIEAGVIAPLYAEMVATIGEAAAQGILDRAIRRAAIAAAEDFAARTPGGTSLKTFQALQHLWTQDDALEIEVLRATETEFHYNVRRCRYAETYRAMGLGAIGICCPATEMPPSAKATTRI
ncbi:hypothetical protein Acid7E03_36480 [Acidisoma sp. 7E03]